MLTRGHDPLRVALLCSRRAPGLRHLLHRDPNRGRSYEVVACVTSDPECVERDATFDARIPRVLHDIRRFYAARGPRLSDLSPRPDYDRLTAETLERFRPDLVVLCGYLHILTEPMLSRYPARIINIHDSDLAILDATGRPKYRGLRSTRDAIVAGELYTRSTVHLVTPDVDVGPLLVRSWAFPTHPLVEAARGWGAADILKAYAYAQREWMMRAAWGPLLARTIDLFAQGEIRVRDGRALVAGALGPRDLAPETARSRPAVPLLSPTGGG